MKHQKRSSANQLDRAPSHPVPRRPAAGRSRRLVMASCACAALLGFGLVTLPTHAQVPDFFRNLLSGGRSASPSQVAEESVLALDTAMKEIYDHALAGYKQNLRNHVPIILALLDETGGRMILYRPGQPPLEAPPVPSSYKLVKSVAHSCMATYQLLAPHLESPQNRSWFGPFCIYRDRCQMALDSLGDLELDAGNKELMRRLLECNITFHDTILKNKRFTYEDIKQYTDSLRNEIPKAVWASARAEVSHWFEVLDGWKASLGNDWDRVYAATNTLYVTRQNNIFYTILAQFMGKEAIGDRLLLFETTEFTPAPDEMLDLLARIVSDRALGKVFFRDYYLMDADLLGGARMRDHRGGSGQTRHSAALAHAGAVSLARMAVAY